MPNSAPRISVGDQQWWNNILSRWTGVSDYRSSVLSFNRFRQKPTFVFTHYRAVKAFAAEGVYGKRPDYTIGICFSAAGGADFNCFADLQLSKRQHMPVALGLTLTDAVIADKYVTPVESIAL